MATRGRKNFRAQKSSSATFSGARKFVSTGKAAGLFPSGVSRIFRARGAYVILRRLMRPCSLHVLLSACRNSGFPAQSCTGHPRALTLSYVLRSRRFRRRWKALEKIRFLDLHAIRFYTRTNDLYVALENMAISPAARTVFFLLVCTHEI